MSRAAVVVALVLALAPACGTDDRKALHETSESLVPAEFRVLREVESACAEGRDFPSCLTVYVAASAVARDRRLPLLDRNARERDWQLAQRRRTDRGSMTLTFTRGRYTAFMIVWDRGRGWRRRCAAKPAHVWIRSCADSVHVVQK